jgi:hypothetical protein
MSWVGLLESIPHVMAEQVADRPHMCMGKSFALMEAQLIVAMVARSYLLHLVPGTRSSLDR